MTVVAPGKWVGSYYFPFFSWYFFGVINCHVTCRKVFWNKADLLVDCKYIQIKIPESFFPPIFYVSSNKFFNMSTKLNRTQNLEAFTSFVLKTCLTLISFACSCVTKLPSVSKGEAFVENKIFFHLKRVFKTKE